jgi:ABC-2 type transport system ATP-binding protein
MRTLDYLDFFGQLQDMSPEWRRERSEELLRRFEMWEARHQRLGEYSKGMRQKLALIRAMLHDPQILFLDEPTSAMDPHSARLVRDSILDLRRDRRTIVVCTHNLPEAELLADRIAIIRRGSIIALGPSAELKSHLLGAPLLELRLAQPLDGLLPLISDLIQVEEQGKTWLRYRTVQPEVVNPLLLGRLAQEGAKIITLSEVPRSLEDVYLKIVEQ